VGILGMAFKANHDDPRDSLAYKLRKILEMEAGEVLCTDVYIQDPHFVPVADLVRRSQVVILAAPHREYKQLDLTGKTVVDVWQFWDKKVGS
jgi:UDP-N-acetyl-D-mannosaminuronic acid dehydrogenase